MIVSDIITRASVLFNDIEYIRVPKEMYIKFLDDALLQLVLARPDSHTKITTQKLTQGPRQSIPEEGIALVGVHSNKKIADGVESYYRPVFQVHKKDLDYFSDWLEPPQLSHDYINDFAFDGITQNTFWVSPPVKDSDVYVEIEYSTRVPALNSTVSIAETQTIDIQDIFTNPIVHYLLYELYSTDSTSANDKEIAASYLSSFYQELSIEQQAQAIVNPKVVPTVQLQQAAQ